MTALTIVDGDTIKTARCVNTITHDGRTYPTARLEQDIDVRKLTGGYLRVESGESSQYKRQTPTIDHNAAVVTWLWEYLPIEQIAEIKLAEIRAAADAEIDSVTGGDIRSQLRALQHGVAVLNRKSKGKPRVSDDALFEHLESIDAAVEAIEGSEAEKIASIDAALGASDLQALIAVEW